MSKKAILVEYAIKTRVIVDIPDDKPLDDDAVIETIHEKALRNIRENVFDDKQYPDATHIIGVEEDTEVPYGTLPNDNKS